MECPLGRYRFNQTCFASCYWLRDGRCTLRAELSKEGTTEKCPTCGRSGYVPLPTPTYRMKRVKRIYPKFYAHYGWFFLPFGHNLEFDRLTLSTVKYIDERIDDNGDTVFKLRPR